ncbi:MAG: AMP-binding protein [Gammaproteobacteria bacterium]|nr:AMP-binding protein [Gammaproteobacteria bacterium]
MCIYTAEFAPQVSRIRGHSPKVKQWVEVDDGNPGADDVIDDESLTENGDGKPLDIERSEDDLLFIYTGGTTGMPKGVMWRHYDLWNVLGGGGNPRLGIPPVENLEEHQRRVESDPPPVNLPLPPLMHGTGSIVRRRRHGAGRHRDHACLQRFRAAARAGCDRPAQGDCRDDRR